MRGISQCIQRWIKRRVDRRQQQRVLLMKEAHYSSALVFGATLREEQTGDSENKVVVI